MRKLVRWSAMGAIAATVLLAGGVAGIAQDKMAEVKTRQDFMKAQGADVKQISDYGKGQGDQQAALKAVDDLLARAPKIDGLFPAGTSSADFPDKSAAKPEIWTDWDKVKLIPAKVQTEEEKLRDAVQKGDRQAVADQLGSLAKNGCGACHGDYRVKKS